MSLPPATCSWRSSSWHHSMKSSCSPWQQRFKPTMHNCVIASFLMTRAWVRQKGDVLSGCCCLERTTAPSSAIHQGEQVNSGGQDLETPALSANERFPGLASEIIVFAECSCQEPIFAQTCCVSCQPIRFMPITLQACMITSLQVWVNSFQL